MATNIPLTDPYTGNIALRSNPLAFPQDAEDQYSYLAVLSPNLNISIAAMNTAIAETEAFESSAANSAFDSAASAEISQANANFKGSWSSLTGAVNVPASVLHSNEYWALLNDLADITTSEPGVSADWAEIPTSIATDTVKILALSFNAEESEIILSSNTSDPLGPILYIHNIANSTTYGKPVTVGPAETIVSVTNDKLQTNLSLYTLNSLLGAKFSFENVADMKAGVLSNNFGTINWDDVTTGTEVPWLGYYDVLDGGDNNGILRRGTHTDDGGSIFSIDANTYVEANLKGKRVDLLKFGVIYGKAQPLFYDTQLNTALSLSESNAIPIKVSGFVRLNTNIVPNTNLNITGIGGNKSGLYWPALSTGIAFDFNTVDYVGITLEKLALIAVDTTAVQVLKCSKVKQACKISDIIINGGDVGLEITESWVSSFNNIYVREGGSVGVKISSPTSITQVNAITIDGIYVQRYETNWIFDGADGGGRAIYMPHGSSELSRKTSMIIDGFGGMFCGGGFYFEGNYSDARGAGGEILDKTKPVNVLIKRSGGSSDAVYSFDKCYFAIADDFNTPTLVVGIYIDPSCPAYVIESNKTTNVCNTTVYVDYDVYNDSTEAIVELKKGKSNSTATYFGNVKITNILASDIDAQTGFTSTWSGIDANVMPTMPGDEYLKYQIVNGGTTTSSFNIQVIRLSDLVVLQTLVLPSGVYVAGEVYTFRINAQLAPKALKIPAVATGDNVTGFVTVYKIRMGDSGDYALGPESNFNPIF